VVLLGGRGEAVVGVRQDPAGTVEPFEQPVAVPAGPPGEPLRLRQLPGPLGQPLGAEQLPADRAGKELVEPGPGPGAGGGGRQQ
jgi:hypothetical protein